MGTLDRGNQRRALGMVGFFFGWHCGPVIAWIVSRMLELLEDALGVEFGVLPEKCC